MKKRAKHRRDCDSKQAILKNTTVGLGSQGPGKGGVSGEQIFRLSLIRFALVQEQVRIQW
jgi:hypothetical protein